MLTLSAYIESIRHVTQQGCSSIKCYFIEKGRLNSTRGARPVQSNKGGNRGYLTLTILIEAPKRSLLWQ